MLLLLWMDRSNGCCALLQLLEVLESALASCASASRWMWLGTALSWLEEVVLEEEV